MSPEARPVGHPHSAIFQRAFRELRVTATAIGLTFGIVAASAALTYVDSFPTEASRRTLVASLSGDAGFSVLFGRVDAIGTVGGYTAYKSYVFLTTIGAIWAMLATTRLLRGEEDSGRWQLVLAGRTNPAKALLSTLAGLASAIGVVFVGTTALTALARFRHGVGFGIGDSILFGVSMVLAPVVFASVAALCSQLARTRRLATALSIGVFAVAFVVRMIGDASPGSHWLLWATPLGWVELMEPLTANDLWPLGSCRGSQRSRRRVRRPPRVATRRRRRHPLDQRDDHGAPVRTDLASRSGGAAQCAGARRLGRGITAMSFVFGIVAKAAGSAVAKSSSADTVLNKLGATGSGATQYVGVVFLLTGAVLALVPANQIGAAREEEGSGRLANILAGPTSRREWLAGRLALTATAVIAIGLLAGAAIWAGARSQGFHLGFASTVLAGLNVVPAALLALAIGAVAVAFIPRRASVAVYFVVGWSLIIDLLGSLVTGLKGLTRLSLFHYVSLAPAEDPNWAILALYTLAAAALVAVAVVGFDHRDLTPD